MVPITTDPGDELVLTSAADARAAEFATVGHTAHLEYAMRIIREGRISAGLAYGHSFLNDKRIETAWVSPNEWPLGHRWGTIKFVFDFEQLLKDREVYWIERADYRAPTFRFLLAEGDRSEYFRRRADCAERFPWLVAEGKHYYHERACVEFMIEGAIPLASAKVAFVSHSGKHCRLRRENPSECEELGIGSEASAARFLAAIVAHETRESQLASLHFSSLSDVVKGWIWLTQVTNRLKSGHSGVVRDDSEEAAGLAKGILSLYVMGRHDECVPLIRMYGSEMAWRRATSALILPKLAPQITRLPITDEEIWKAIVEP